VKASKTVITTLMLVTIVSAISVVDAYADYGMVLDSAKITGNTVLTSNTTQTVAFEAGDRMGISVTNIEDFDGDGVPDIIIAMGGAHTSHISEGDRAMNILLMNSDGTVKDQRAITYDEKGLPDGCYNSAAFDKNDIGFGEKITWLGSLTEGLDPVLMVASVDEGAGNFKGNVYALSLKYNSDDTVSPVTACTRINEGVGGFNPLTSDNYPSGDTYFGYPIVNAGDLNDDGITDVYVGIDNGYGGIGATEFYILYLQQNSTSAVTVKDHKRLPVIHTTVTNNSIIDDIILLELDGNTSTTEIAFSASGVFGGPANKVYIGSFNDDFTLSWNSVISELTGHTFADNDEFGESLLNLGDIDGDGITDIVVGSENDYSDERELGLTGNEGHGALYVLFMNNNGTVKEYQKISNLYGNLTDGTTSNEFWRNAGAFGAALSTIDLDADGVDELIATSMDDNSNGSNSGAIYILELKIAQIPSTSFCQNLTIDELISIYPVENVFDNRDGTLGSKIKGTSGNDLMIASDNGDTLIGKKGNDCLIGGSGDDILKGNRGQDEIYGNAGNDILRGGKNIDTIYGGEGNDRLFGGKNNDFLYGNEGDDNLNGRKGIDTCDGGTGTNILKKCEL